MCHFSFTFLFNKKNVQLRSHYNLWNLSGVVFCYESPVAYIHRINRHSYSYLILKEKFVTKIMVFYLQSYHFMTEKFNTQIDWYRKFGITNQIFSIFIDPKYMRKMEAETWKSHWDCMSCMFFFSYVSWFLLLSYWLNYWKGLSMLTSADTKSERKEQKKS